MSTCLTTPTPLPLPTILAEDYETKKKLYACLGHDLQGDTPIPKPLDFLRDAWNGTSGLGGKCSEWFESYIYNEADIRSFNFNRYASSRDYLRFLLYRYYSAPGGGDDVRGHIPSMPGQVGYDYLQESLISFCASPTIPGVCETALVGLCSGCQNSRDQLAQYDYGQTRKLCGCYIPPDSRFNSVEPQCDPVCAPLDTAHKTAPTKDGPNPVECRSAVCVIDEIAISATNSRVGSLSFTQVCPQCQGNTGCRCLMETSIKDIGTKLGIDSYTSFKQYCGGAGSVCLEIDSQTRQLTEVECSKQFGDVIPTYSLPVPWWVWLIALLLILLVFLAVFSLRSPSLPSAVLVPGLTSRAY